MKYSASDTSRSCIITESFDAAGVTGNGGANLVVDFLRNDLKLLPHLANISVEKAPWATFTVAQDVECLMTGYMLGVGRVAHIDEIEHDPLLKLKLGLEKLPQHCTLYRTLGRFQDASDVASIHPVNQHILQRIIPANTEAILDIDTTIETVHGQQEGSSVGYNPRYHGRASYQPYVAFEGKTRAAVHAQLRSGDTPNADDTVTFYNSAKAQLPQGCKLRHCRADRAFGSEKFCSQLEVDGVKYTIKLRMTSGLWKHVELHARWKLVWIDDLVEIQSASVSFQVSSWSKSRRIVLIRTRRMDEKEPGLFPEYDWDYQAIVTNLYWEAEEIWAFYNQRCTCENYIKELKYGLHINAISKANFWPNAADLMIKIISYNVLLALRNLSTLTYQKFSIERFRRTLLRVPAILVKHSRQWRLRLPSYWPHKEAWQQLRSAITMT